MKKLYLTLILAAIGTLLQPGEKAHAQAATAPSEPWLSRPWRQDMTIMPGIYKGPKEEIWSNDKKKQTFAPGCIVNSAIFRLGGESKFAMSESMFRDVSIGMGLWCRMDATKCAFDSCRMEKIQQWYDTKNSSTVWRFNDCLFSEIFMRANFLVMDCSIRASNCTFVELKAPGISYRNNPANEAQQNWLRFENCRFVRCEIPESFLIATINCEYVECKFTDRKEWKLAKPLEVFAYTSDIARPESYQKANLKVNFINGKVPKPCGSSLAYSYQNKKLNVASFSSMAVARILGATKAEAPPPTIAAAKSTPAPTPATGDVATPTAGGTREMTEDIFTDILSGAGANSPSSATGADAGPKGVTLKKTTALANVLLPAEIPISAKITAVALPGEGGKPDEIRFTQPTGDAMTKALAEVLKHLQWRYPEWPQGHKIEINLSDKWSPKFGSSVSSSCGLLVDALISGGTPDPLCAVTGNLGADGFMLPVGALASKLQAAAAAQFHRIGVPMKNEADIADLLFTENIDLLSNIEIYGLDSFEQAREVAMLPLKPSVEQASQNFAKVRAMIQQQGKLVPSALANPAVTAALWEVLTQAPNHLSAKYLYLKSNGKNSPTLSVGGSLKFLEQNTAILLVSTGPVATSSGGGSVRKITTLQLAAAVSKLRGIKDKVDPKVRPTVEALIRFGQYIKDFQALPLKGDPKAAAKALRELKESAAEVDKEWAKWQTERAVLGA